MCWQNLLVVFSFSFVILGAFPQKAVADRLDPITTEGTVALDFSALDAHGVWAQVEPYGLVWRPRSVSADWRPYTLGTWAYGSQGLTWYAEESWGAITYHYGRWTWDPSSRWSWVPGQVWSPANVAWRSGGGYLGWAPLPPELDRAEQGNNIDVSTWIFVKAAGFADGRLSVAALPVVWNATAFARTSQPSPKCASR